MDEPGDGLRRSDEDVKVRTAMGLTKACLDRATAERRRNIVGWSVGAVLSVGSFKIVVVMVSQRQPCTLGDRCDRLAFLIDFQHSKLWKELGVPRRALPAQLTALGSTFAGENDWLCGDDDG